MPISSEDFVCDEFKRNGNITITNTTTYALIGPIDTISRDKLLSIFVEFDLHSSTGSANDYNYVIAMNDVAIYADKAITHTGHDIHFCEHQYLHQSAEHIINIIMSSYNHSGVNVCISNKIINASNSIGNIEDNNAINAVIVTNNSINGKLSKGRISDHVVTDNYESMSHTVLNCSDTYNAGYETLTCIVTHDYGLNSRNHTHLYDLDYDNETGITPSRANSGCMSTKRNTCDMSNGNDCNVQSGKQNRMRRDTNNNTMHNDEMENCYLLGLNGYHVLDIQTMTLKLEEIESTIYTLTTHGELESRVCHSARRRGLGTIIIELRKKHVHNQLIAWMTKAYRRGVTCTREVRICLVSSLYPYLLGSPLLGGN